MATKDYSYPRVKISTTAMTHSSTSADAEDTTVLFAPIITKKGPEGVVTSVHTLSEFISTFGDLDYDANGQMALNVYNWLTNGGTVYVCRLGGSDLDQKLARFTAPVSGSVTSTTYYLTTTTTSIDSGLNIDNCFDEVKSYSTFSDLTKTTGNRVAYLNTSGRKVLVCDEDGSHVVYTYNSLYTDVVDLEDEDFSNDQYYQAVQTYAIINNTSNAVVLLYKRNINGSQIVSVSDGKILEVDNTEESLSSLTSSGTYTLRDNAGATYYDISTADGFLYFLVEKGSEIGLTNTYNSTNYTCCEMTGYYVIDSDAASTAYDGFDLHAFLYGSLTYVADTDSATGVTSISYPESIGYAKYYGPYYEGISVAIRKVGTSSTGNVIFNITVSDTNGTSSTIVEQYYRRTLSTYSAALSASDYIGSLDLTDIIADLESESTGTTITLTTIYETNDNEITVDTDYLETFWSEAATSSYSIVASKVLGNRLETPIDLIMDAGYPIAIKKAMMAFICNTDESATRDDIIGIFDVHVINGYLTAPTEVVYDDADDGYEDFKATNIALYDQWFRIEDSTFTDQQIYVGPTYFLSELIPYNDLNYGIQFPTAGLRRGILSDCLSVNNNPLPDEKETLFTDRVNYVEKTPREYAFMSQRTYDGSTEDEYTALSFLNNARVLERMKKDIEETGRKYLFEFNDATTLSLLSSVLNKYVTTWISNRTLSSASVTVAQNAYSDEAVDVTLSIKFTGTIEVISVDITIE